MKQATAPPRHGASCRFHGFHVERFTLVTVEFYGRRYFKETVVRFGMIFEDIVFKIKVFFLQMRSNFNHQCFKSFESFE